MSLITIKGIVEEDFTNYKKPSMVILFPTCTWKCDKDCGEQVCQNKSLAELPDVRVSVDRLVHKYLDNTITKAVVLSGLEPLDSPAEMMSFVKTLRVDYGCKDDIVIYTGYEEQEQTELLSKLRSFKGGKIIVKFGRYVPNNTKTFDKNLGVWLSNTEQHSVVL